MNGKYYFVTAYFIVVSCLISGFCIWRFRSSIKGTDTGHFITWDTIHSKSYGNWMWFVTWLSMYYFWADSCFKISTQISMLFDFLSILCAWALKIYVSRNLDFGHVDYIKRTTMKWVVSHWCTYLLNESTIVILLFEFCLGYHLPIPGQWDLGFLEKGAMG